VRYIVNISTGFRTQEFARPVPCGEEVDIHPDTAADAVKKGWLVPAETEAEWLARVEREKAPQSPAPVAETLEPAAEVAEASPTSRVRGSRRATEPVPAADVVPSAD
jgi:hypothetical protein